MLVDISVMDEDISDKDNKLDALFIYFRSITFSQMESKSNSNINFRRMLLYLFLLIQTEIARRLFRIGLLQS